MNLKGISEVTLEMQIRNYEHVGSTSHLGVNKAAKITNTMQQKSDDGNLKVPKILGKASWEEKEITESMSCVKNGHNLDYH